MIFKCIKKGNKIISFIESKISPRYNINHNDSGIIGFIDVGSIGGLPDPWCYNANHIKFLLNFEPNGFPKRWPNSLTYNTALWEREGTLPFNIYKGNNGTGSSIFRQNFDYVKSNFNELKSRGDIRLAETWFDRSQLVDTIKVECRTIDSILSDEIQNTPFHFMKIDAQGAEYNILKGAHNFLSQSCLGLHLELFVLPLYEGIVLLDEVEHFLKNYGFRLVKKFPAHGTFNSQHDCLFLKDNGDTMLTNMIKKVYKL